MIISKLSKVSDSYFYVVFNFVENVQKKIIFIGGNGAQLLAKMKKKKIY